MRQDGGFALSESERRSLMSAAADIFNMGKCSLADCSRLQKGKDGRGNLSKRRGIFRKTATSNYFCLRYGRSYKPFTESPVSDFALKNR